MNHGYERRNVSLRHKIGKGYYSDVYEAIFMKNICAVKFYKQQIYRVQPDFDKFVTREMATLCRLNHPHCVRFLGSFAGTAFEGQVGIIMEYAHGGTLAECLELPMTQPDRVRTIHQIASGLNYLHSQRMLHRDIKPDNILFRDLGKTQAILADFGLTTDASYASYGGATHYQAPEAKSRYCRESDIYSLAIVAWQILSGNAGFHRDNINNSLGYDTVFLDNPKWKAIIIRSLSVDPRVRPSAVEFMDAFDDDPLGRMLGFKESYSSSPPPPHTPQFGSQTKTMTEGPKPSAQASSSGWDWGAALVGALAVGAGVIAVGAAVSHALGEGDKKKENDKNKNGTRRRR